MSSQGEGETAQHTGGGREREKERQSEREKRELPLCNNAVCLQSPREDPVVTR